MSEPLVPTRLVAHDALHLRLRRLLVDHGDKVRKIGPRTWQATFARRCFAPLTVIVSGRPEAPAGERYVNVGEATRVPSWVEYVVPCRRCPACLVDRARLWQHRAEAEVLGAQRTWFCTLTFSPERRFHYRLQAVKACSARGEAFDTLDDHRQFGEIVRLQARAFALAIKRLRKNTQCQVRYLLVAERHKDGNSHLHALVHEVQGSKPVTKRELQAEWHEGFSVVKLADKSAARYVTKYLAKELLTRVRASQNYGGGRGGRSPRLANSSRSEATVRAPLARPTDAYPDLTIVGDGID